MATIFWNTSNSDNWNDAAAWSPQAVPGAEDSATLGAIGFAIAQPYTVTVTAAISVDDVVITDTNAVLLDSGPVTVTILSDLTNAGNLNVEYAGSTTIKKNADNTGTIEVDTQGGADPSGGSTLAVDGTLTNGGLLDIGGAGLASATMANVAALVNSGTIDITGGPSALATLSVGAVAPAALAGSFNLTGDALLEYASGGIGAIGSGGGLTLSGAQARVAVATGSTTVSSALTGLSTNSGTFELENGAAVTLTGLLANAGTFESFSGATPHLAAVNNSGVFSVANGGTVSATGNFDNAGNIYVDSSDGQSGGVLTIGGTLTNSGALNMGTNVENGVTTVNVEGAGGVINTGTIDLSDDRSPGSTNQDTLDVANAAAGFGVAGQVQGTVSLVGDSLIEFASGGLTKIVAGAVLSLDGGESRVAIAGTNTADNTGLSGLTENDGTFSVADGATVTTTTNLDNTNTIDVDNSDGQSGGDLTIGGTLTNSGSLRMGTNVENGDTTVNVEGAGGVINTGTIDLSDDRSPGSTNQDTLDVANAAAGFGVAGQVQGTVSLVGGSLIEFASGGLTKIVAGAELSLDGGESRIAVAGTNTADNTGLSGLTENDGTFSVADGATVTTTTNLDNTNTIYVDSADGQNGADLTIGGTLTNSGALNMGTNVENGVTTVNVEGAGGITNAGTIDLSDDRSPGSTNQDTLDVVNAAAGFGVAGQVQGTVTLVGDSLVKFASGGITKIVAGAVLSLDGAESRVAIAGTNTADNTGLSGFLENDGTFSVADGATVTTTTNLNNTNTIYVDSADGQNGAVLTIGGTLTNSGSLNMGTNVEFGLTTVNVEGAGGIDNSGNINLSNDGSGPTSQTTIDVANAAAGFGTVGQVTGTVSLEGHSLIEFASGAITKIASGATLALNGGGSRIAIAGTNTDDDTALNGLAENDGAFYLADGATATTTGALDNVGTIGVDLGDGQHGAVLTIGGALTNSGSFSFGQNVEDGTTTVNIDGALNNTGSITAVNSGNSGGAGDTALNLSGLLTNSGTLNFYNGVDGRVGGVNNSQTLNLYGAVGVPTSMDVIGVAGNSGEITVGGSAEIGVFGLFTDSGTLNAGGEVDAAGGLTVTGTGTLALQGGTIASSGAGGLTLDAGATASGEGKISVATVNDATLTASGGLLDIAGAITGTGGLAIGSGAELELGAATAQTVAFNGDVGTLKLDQPGDLTGAITGLVQGDTIDLGGVQATSALVSGSTLTVVAGAQTYKYQVSGAGLAAGAFAIESDQQGGTNLVLGTPGPTISGPLTQTAFLGWPTVLGPLTIADPAAAGKPLTVTITAASGTLTGAAANAGSLSGSGTTKLTLTGDLADINTMLAGVAYNGVTAGASDNVVVTVTDTGNATAAQTVAVTTQIVPYTPPVLNIEQELAVILGVATAVDGTTISDPYAEATDDQITFTAITTGTPTEGDDNATLTANGGPGGTVTGQGTNIIAITGTTQQINSYLADDEEYFAIDAADAKVLESFTNDVEQLKNPAVQKIINEIYTLRSKAYSPQLNQSVKSLIQQLSALKPPTTVTETAEQYLSPVQKLLQGLRVLGQQRYPEPPPWAPPPIGGPGVTITTYDQGIYKFDAEGEFVLTKSTQTGDSFQIQIRLQPSENSPSVSAITESATEFGDDRLTFATGRAAMVWENGAPLQLTPGAPAKVSGGQVTQAGANTYVLTWNTGEVAVIVNEGSYLELTVNPGDDATIGTVQGLMGAFAGVDDEFILPDETILKQPLSSATLYGEFANAWRVTNSTSLFDYGAGQSTSTFTNKSFPLENVTLGDLPSAVVAIAKNAVAAAGITDAGVAAAIEFDFLASGGDPTVIQNDKSLYQGFDDSIPADVTSSGSAPTVLGVVAPVASVPQASSGATDVTFDVYLTAVESGGTVVDYSVVNSNDDDFTATEFGGTLPSGSITIAAGKTTGTINIAVPENALGAFPSKDVALQISSPASVPIFAAGSVEAVTAATATGPSGSGGGGSGSSKAVPELEYLGNVGTFSQSGDNYILNLGDIQYGELVPALQFAVANANTAPGDSLSGSFTWPTIAGFVNSVDGADVSGAGLTTSIGAGLNDQVLTVTTIQNKFGAQADVITFTPVDTNASGYSKQLAPITLTIDDTLQVPGTMYSQAWGDVHIVTYGGATYNFQAAGEFILAKSTVADDSFDIQIRLQPYTSSSAVTFITQAAISLGGDDVTFATAGTGPISVRDNGVLTTLSMSDPTLTLAGGTITEISPAMYKVVWKTGETMTVTEGLYDGVDYLSVSDSAPDVPGSVIGLQVGDDLPTTTCALYGAYADSWRVTQDDSLFYYTAGQTTATFTVPGFPSDMVSLADLPASVLAQAAGAVKAAGITDPNLAQQAELDYIATGSLETVNAGANANQQIAGVSEPTITPCVTPTTAIGVMADATEVTEAASGVTAVTFTAYLTGTEATATTVDYAVTALGAGFFAASAFGGSLPSGSVVIAAGQTEAQFTINLPQGALGAAAADNLQVQVSSPGAVLPVFAPTAQTEVVNYQKEAGLPAVAELAYLGNDGAFSYDAATQTYTLNVGGLTQGSAVDAEQFAVVNAADDASDNLDGTFTAPTGEGFVVTGDSLPSPLAAGETYQGLYISVNTADLGANGVSLTFDPTDVNGSGYSAALTPLTLKIVDSVVAAAKPQVNTPTTIIFPNVRVGATDSQHVSVTNTAASGAADLGVTLTASGEATASGAVANLAPGATDAADLSVGIDTSVAGADGGSVTENFVSSGGGATSAIPEESPYIDVFGSVYRPAAPTLSAPSIIVHVGDVGSTALKIGNGAVADGYSENLVATIAGVTGPTSLTAGQSSGEIAPDTSVSLPISFSTATAAQYTANAVVDLASDGGTGSGAIDGLGQLALAAQNVPLDITVDNYAAAALVETSGGGALTQNGTDYTLDLGTIAQGSSPVVVALSAKNAAAGPADALAGVFAEIGDAAFANALTSVSGLAAGQSAAAGTVTLSTATAGGFSETVTFEPTGSNASGYSGALQNERLTIRGVVAGSAAPALGFNSPVGFSSPTTATFTGSVAEIGGSIKSVALYNGVVNAADLIGTATLNGSAWSLTATLKAGKYTALQAVATDANGHSTTAGAPYKLSVGVVGQAFAAEEYDYSGSTLIDRIFFNADGSTYLGDELSTDPVTGGYDEMFTRGSFFAAEPYKSFLYKYDAAGDQLSQSYFNADGTPYLASTTHALPYGGEAFVFSGGSDLVGAPWSSYEYDYDSANVRILEKFFYTSAPSGADYASAEYDYNGGHAITKVIFSGVSGQPFSSYENDYVGAKTVYDGTKFTFTSVPAGAAYSSFETDYDAAGAFTGEKIFYASIANAPYASLEEDYNADDLLTRVVESGVTNEPFHALELDYNNGVYAGYKAYYTISGETFTGEEVDVAASDDAVTRIVYSGLSGTPYSSLTVDYANKQIVSDTFDFTASTANYISFQVVENAAGQAEQQIVSRNDGSHRIVGYAADQTLTALGEDVFTGGGASETFVFDPAFGQDRITDFSSYVSGAGHDTLSLASSEFASVAAVLSATADTSAGALITDALGDTITLTGVTKAMLTANQGDITLHG